MQQLLVTRIENGFIVQVCNPFSPGQIHYAKNVTALTALIERLLEERQPQ